MLRERWPGMGVRAQTGCGGRQPGEGGRAVAASGGAMERQRQQPGLQGLETRCGEESIHMGVWVVTAMRDGLPAGGLIT